MTENELTLSPPIASCSLDKPALKRWWSFWFAETSGICLSFLIAFPFFAAFLYWTGISKDKMSLENPAATVILTALPIVLSVFACWLSVARAHLCRVHYFAVKEHGIMLGIWPSKSVFVPWAELKSVYLSASQEYVIESKNGDYFLAADLKDAESCIKEVKSRIKQGADYKLNLYVNNGWRQKNYFALIAVAAALLQPLILSFVKGKQIAWDWQSLAVLVIILAIIALFTWINLVKSARIVRAGLSGIYIADAKDTYSLNWSQIRSLSKISSSLLLLVTEKGSWVIPWHSYVSTTGTKAEKLKNFDSVFNVKEELLALSEKSIQKQKKLIS